MQIATDDSSLFRTIFIHADQRRSVGKTHQSADRGMQSLLEFREDKAARPGAAEPGRVSLELQTEESYAAPKTRS